VESLAQRDFNLRLSLGYPPMDLSCRAARIQSFTKAWRKACVQAKLGNLEPRKHPVTGKAMAPEYTGKLFHDLRQSCVRNLIRAGISRDVARSISGHISDSVFSRYNIISPADVRDAGSKLEEYLKKVGDTSGIHEQKSGREAPRVQ
jgi:hypothetical protein